MSWDVINCKGLKLNKNENIVGGRIYIDLLHWTIITIGGLKRTDLMSK